MKIILLIVSGCYRESSPTIWKDYIGIQTVN